MAHRLHEISAEADLRHPPAVALLADRSQHDEHRVAKRRHERPDVSEGLRHLPSELRDEARISGADGDPDAWGLVDGIDDTLLDRGRGRSSALLADLVRDRTGAELAADTLIVGFARRFAPYKRATLLLRHSDRLFHLLGDEERPVHLVFAGKAHPSDDVGKELISQVIELSTSQQANGRIIFIPDYDMDIAHALVQGCDVWLNHPIRPREASGTSGEKAVLNGGLNCSILDGWWAEMFDGENGWGIPASPETDPDARDEQEAGWLLDSLTEIAGEYYSSRPAFNARIRHAWRTLGPRVTAARMLRDYRDGWYQPALYHP